MALTLNGLLDRLAEIAYVNLGTVAPYTKVGSNIDIHFQVNDEHRKTLVSTIIELRRTEDDHRLCVVLDCPYVRQQIKLYYEPATTAFAEIAEFFRSIISSMMIDEWSKSDQESRIELKDRIYHARGHICVCMQGGIVKISIPTKDLYIGNDYDKWRMFCESFTVDTSEAVTTDVCLECMKWDSHFNDKLTCDTPECSSKDRLLVPFRTKKKDPYEDFIPHGAVKHSFTTPIDDPLDDIQARLDKLIRNTESYDSALSNLIREVRKNQSITDQNLMMTTI